MSLLDNLLSDADGPTVKNPCRVALIAEGLDEPYKSAFMQLVNLSYAQGGMAPGVASAKAARAGLKISENTIYRHRRELCGCERQVNA